MDYKEKVIALLNSQELSKEQKEKLENIFPELKESGDEEVRLEIRNFIWEYPDKLPERDKWLAWFEKQGENKSDFSNIRIWKYIVDMVLTEKYGIGNYIDNPDTERIAKKLQEKYGNIEKQGEDILIEEIKRRKELGQANDRTTAKDVSCNNRPRPQWRACV